MGEIDRKPVPLWMLSPKDEIEINTRHGKFAREKCKGVLTAFTDCNRGRLLSTSWACRGERDKMMECMLHHMQPDVREQIANDYIEEKQQQNLRALQEKGELENRTQRM
ncbi:hypothetical protein V1525DRAFT_429978 [Lipomyces kononenkoae]|uniref:Uncharacterized protein n=1 Tax=Lipomyces kononenkoae TaxID=34357 RepID=A0ACC3T8J5_LIPKO